MPCSRSSVFSLDYLVVLLTNKVHLEALVTKLRFVGKSKADTCKKSIHATNMTPRVRSGWDTKIFAYVYFSLVVGLYRT